MKKRHIILSLLSVLAVMLLLGGCGFFVPSDPAEDLERESGDSESQAQESAETNSDAEPEDAVEGLIDKVVEQEAAKPVVEENLTNQTNMTVELEQSGSLYLQTDLGLCPHLAESFECDRYDIRRCAFKTFVGKNGFYPDLMNCRDGETRKGENPQNKYCIIQSCAPLQEDNIAYAYGGTTAYAEYRHSVEKVGGGIMTHYELRRCGEMHKEFDTDFDCTVYKSELDGLWVN